jgi:hypothetical protein
MGIPQQSDGFQKRKTLFKRRNKELATKAEELPVF